MKRNAKAWLWASAGIAIVAIVSLGYWGASRRATAASGGDWITEKIDRGAIATTVTATGSVNPVTTVVVGSYVSGPILAIDVDFNSQVTTGQRVAKIDPRPFQTKVRQAEANLATAKARAIKARADEEFKQRSLVRAQQLVAGDFVAKSELDQAISDHQQAVAEVALEDAGIQQAEAALEEARINLSYTDIRSPVDGVVISRNIDVGQTVAASFQTPTLFLIAHDLTKMQVEGNVSESDIGSVHEGQTAEFTVDAYPGRVFRGTVNQVRNAATAVQNVVTYDVVAGVENPDLVLKPGMTATITMVTAKRDDVLRAPVRALRFHPENATTDATRGAKSGAPRGHKKDGDEQALWILESGRPKRVPVAIGLTNDRHAELLGGELESGAEVIVASRRATAKSEAPATSPFTPQRPRPR